MRPTPYEMFAANFSRSKINSFFPNTMKMDYKGFLVMNSSAGPFNSTFYRMRHNFYNRFRVVRFEVGVTTYPNYTAQMFWIWDGRITPKRTRYEPLNKSSEEAEAIISWATYQIDTKKWFTAIPTTFMDTMYVIAVKYNYTPPLKYFTVGLKYNSTVGKTVRSYIMNIILKQNTTSKYFYFSRIGMGRVRPRPRIFRKPRLYLFLC